MVGIEELQEIRNKKILYSEPIEADVFIKYVLQAYVVLPQLSATKTIEIPTYLIVHSHDY